MPPTTGPGSRVSGGRPGGAERAPRGSDEAAEARDSAVRHPRTGAVTFALALAAAVGLAGVLAAAPAAAAPFVEVTYDLSDTSAFSTIPPLNLTTEIPPHGTITGKQTVRYASDSASGIAPGTGPAELVSFYLDVHATVGAYTYTPGGGQTFTTLNTSDLHFEFLRLTSDAIDAGGVGVRLSGGTVTPLGASGIFQVSGDLHCFKLCRPIGVTATTRTPLVTQRFTAPLPRLTGATGRSHTIRGTATGVNFDVRPEEGYPVGVTGTTFIVGREVQRTPVPEPGTLPLLAGGLVGLGLAGAAWRRRRGGHARAPGSLALLAPAALGLALGLHAGSSHAASTVDVTYDLAETDLVWDVRNPKWVVSNDDDSFTFEEKQQPGIISGEMKVEYASDSSSGMPILTGTASLLTFNLTAKSVDFGGMTASLHWQLTTPATGRLTSGGALTGLNVNLLMTGRADCKFTVRSQCTYAFGLPTFTVYPSYSRSGPIYLAGEIGPYAGTQSTRHTLTGRGRAIGWQPGAGQVGLGYDRWDVDDVGGAYLVGREIVREADGHATKVIPEPGTLLLLGAGTAGLALVRRRERGGWRH